MPALPTLNLKGTAYEIGWQHAQQIAERRPFLLSVIEARLAELSRLDADRPPLLQPAVEALEALDAPLIEQLQGLASGLEVSFDRMLRYTLSSYLRDRQRAAAIAGSAEPRDGCTNWAAAAPATVHGKTLLVKNRDYRRDHIPLQVLAHVAPTDAYRYVCIGSAGSPMVFSSGINEAGLAVADTHVLSRDLGPGVPRFSLMREMLERHASTAAALVYLRSVQHMGGGTLLLADRSGHLALCESGYGRCAFEEPTQGYLASTNHFATGALAEFWIDDDPPLLRGNSQARRDRVLAALAEGAGQVDASWAQSLMAAHGDLLDALCRHPLGAVTSTISSAILLPDGLDDGAPALLLAAGQPCTAGWEMIPVGQAGVDQGNQR